MKYEGNENHYTNKAKQLKKLEDKILLYTNLRTLFAWITVLFAICSVVYLFFIL